MTEENDDDLIILEDGASQEKKSIENGNTVNEPEKNIVDISAVTEWVNDDVPRKQNVDSTEKKVDPSGEATATWTPCDEEQAPGEDDDVVIIDECGEGDEFLESTTNPPVEITESKNPSEGKTHATLSRKKKRVLKRKVVRLPREVFDYMGRIEEDGTVRLNLSQFSLFYLNEISKKFSTAPVEVWDTTDVPLMDVSVPPTAKKNPFLIVDNFSNEPVARAAQEKRLQAILENRKKLAEMQKQREANIIAVTKILPAEGTHSKGAARNKNKRSMKCEEQNGKEAAEEETPNKKRSAERSASSSTPESGSAAKQPKLEEKNSTQTKSGKTFPKKAGPTPGKTGSQNASNTSARGSSSEPKARRGSNRNRMSRKRLLPHPGSGISPFVSPRIEHREWQSSPAPFLDQRYPRDSVYGGQVAISQMRYGDPYPFDDRRVGGDMSPWARPSIQRETSWARPSTQPDEMYKLESMMRRTVPESVSPLDAIRQVEKMGLTSVVGALLSAVNSRNSGYATEHSPSRRVSSMVDDPHRRSHRLPSDLDYSRSPIRDISKYVEPLEEFYDSSRMRSTTGEGTANGVGGSGISPYGQSYPAFAAQSFGGMVDYERDRSQSPVGRSYR